MATLDEDGNLQVKEIDGKTLFQQKVEAPVVDAQPQSGVSDSVSRLLFRPDGRAVAVVEPKAIRVVPLDGAPVQLLRYEKVLPGGEGNSVWWSNDGTRITSMRKQDKPNQQVVSWNLATGKQTTITNFSDEIGAIDCSPDGKRVLIGFDIGFWQVRRLDDPSAAPLESEPAAHISTVRAVAFSGDGRRFATGGWDGLIKIWSSEGTLLKTLYGNDWPVHQLIWSNDGRHLVSLTRERTTQLWSLDTGRPVLRFEAAADQAVTVITEDGRIFGPPTGASIASSGPLSRSRPAKWKPSATPIFKNASPVTDPQPFRLIGRPIDRLRLLVLPAVGTIRPGSGDESPGDTSGSPALTSQRRAHPRSGAPHVNDLSSASGHVLRRHHPPQHPAGGAH